MAISRMITLMCDHCLTGADESHWTVVEARAAGRRDGWRIRRGEDLCPACSVLATERELILHPSVRPLRPDLKVVPPITQGEMK